MEANRLVAVVAFVVVLIAVVAAVQGPASRRDSALPPTASGRGPSVTTPADRTVPPLVGGRPLDLLAPDQRPPEPAQWGGGRGPIPSNSWWSSAVAGPGVVSLWPQPLALTISAEGRVAIASPARARRPDGSSEVPFDPAVFLESSSVRSTRVVSHGPLDATLRLAGRSGSLDLTMVQGSPLVELTTHDPIELLVPGLSARLRPGSTRALRIRTARGTWLLAGGDAFNVSRDGDHLTVVPGRDGRVVIGPLPTGAQAHFDDIAADLAAHPVVHTAERISVAADGTTTQVLSQSRAGVASAGVESLWALQPVHQRYATGTGPVFGTVPSARGSLPVVAGSELRLVYPAVPVLWSAVASPGTKRPPAGVADVTAEGYGSYFGGKLAYTHAALGDVLSLAGDASGAAGTRRQAARLLSALASLSQEPSLRWDPTWGSVIIDPAEFGSDRELNDHQLQYGYWVAAASLLADVDPAAADRYRDVIDLLVADYAGAATVPGAPSSLPAQRTWSPYEGHSWASGTAPFADGNNLESSSESSFAWWAAARWFLSTGRPAEASVFIGRFTIETAVAGFDWLPEGGQLPGRNGRTREAAQRPWSGVVWSGKTDLSTWFDPSPESALGIRLLPLGPASLARYGSAESIAAAKARWAWCDDVGRGCVARWANLLDSDAAVAGRPPLVGPDPEPSTTDAVSRWWRALWDAGEPATGWDCTVGTVARRAPGGVVTILASNPGPDPSVATCRDADGTVRWSGTVARSAVATLQPPSG